MLVYSSLYQQLKVQTRENDMEETFSKQKSFPY